MEQSDFCYRWKLGRDFLLDLAWQANDSIIPRYLYVNWSRTFPVDSLKYGFPSFFRSYPPLPRPFTFHAFIAPHGTLGAQALWVQAKWEKGEGEVLQFKTSCGFPVVSAMGFSHTTSRALSLVWSVLRLILQHMGTVFWKIPQTCTDWQIIKSEIVRNLSEMEKASMEFQKPSQCSFCAGLQRATLRGEKIYHNWEQTWALWGLLATSLNKSCGRGQRSDPNCSDVPRLISDKKFIHLG